MVPFTTLGCPVMNGKGRAERGIVRCLAVAKAADGPLECFAKSSSTRRRTPSREGAADGKLVLGSDANGPCAWSERAPQMVVASGDLAVHWPLAALRGC